jgi:hypothetical protein
MLAVKLVVSISCILVATGVFLDLYTKNPINETVSNRTMLKLSISIFPFFFDQKFFNLSLKAKEVVFISESVI